MSPRIFVKRLFRTGNLKTVVETCQVKIVFRPIQSIHFQEVEAID